jgi:hypothetical protein
MFLRMASSPSIVKFNVLLSTMTPVGTHRLSILSCSPKSESVSVNLAPSKTTGWYNPPICRGSARRPAHARVLGSRKGLLSILWQVQRRNPTISTSPANVPGSLVLLGVCAKPPGRGCSRDRRCCSSALLPDVRIRSEDHSGGH